MLSVTKCCTMFLHSEDSILIQLSERQQLMNPLFKWRLTSRKACLIHFSSSNLYHENKWKKRQTLTEAAKHRQMGCIGVQAELRMLEL